MVMNGIFFLILSISFSSGVALTMKVANTKGINLWQFLAINYLVCMLNLMAWGAWKTITCNSAFIWCLSIFIGSMYVLCLWLFNKAISAEGLALSTTLMRLSAAIPTLGSLIFFTEQANFYQMVGIVLAFLCLPLASRDPITFGKQGKNIYKGIIWGLLLFAVYGITDFTFKIQAELEPLAEPKAFMASIFGTALLLTLPALFKNSMPTKSCIVYGFIMGTTNVLATYFWIKTLSHMPGSVAFPTLGMGVIAVTTFFSLVFWHEKLRPANYLFLALACVSVFLINMV